MTDLGNQGPCFETPAPTAAEAACQAELLAGLLAFRQALDDAPDEQAAAVILRQSVQPLPGVVDCALSSAGRLRPAGALSRHPGILGPDGRVRLKAAAEAGLTVLPLHQRGSGHLLLELDDPDAFAPYRALAENLAIAATEALERRRVLTEIEARVVLRTAELSEANRRLRDTVERLSETNAELERFAYVASHDLQEPLRMIVSYNQLLLRRYADRLDSDASEFIGFAVDAGLRMQRLIGDLLSFSRATRRPLRRKPVDCAALLATVLRTLSEASAEAGARVTVGALPTVTGDEIQLGELFQNLIANAIKFRRAGCGARIHVAAEAVDGGWEFSVSDDGIGIPAEHHAGVFTVFERLQPDSSYPGSGIGLATCKRIVERHGGRIWIAPEAETGTTVRFTLPAGDQDTDANL